MVWRLAVAEKKVKTSFLHDTCCRTAHNQAQSVEQQRRQGREREQIARSCGGLRIGDRQHENAALPVKPILYRSNRSVWSWFTAVGHVYTGRTYLHTASTIGCGMLYCTALRRDRDFDGAACTSVAARPSSSSRASCCYACS